MKKISASSMVLAGLGLSLYTLGFETAGGFQANFVSGPESVDVTGSNPQNRVSGMADGDGHYLRPFVQIGYKQKIKRRLDIGFTMRYYPLKMDSEIYIPVSRTHRGGLGIGSVINEDIEIGRLVFHDIGLRSTVSLSF